MVHYFIYATDDSVSTWDVDYFHKKGLETLYMFKKEVKVLQDKAGGSQKSDKIVYLHWSHECVQVKEREVEIRYKEKSAKGKITLPRTLIEWIEENVTDYDLVQLLYVITDGEVCNGNIRAIDRYMIINYVKFFVFNTDIADSEMALVGCFFCNNKHYEVYFNEEQVLDYKDLSTPFYYRGITAENFHENKKVLKSYIKRKYLSKRASDILALLDILNLKSLQRRLSRELREDIHGLAPLPPPRIDLNVKDKETFINLFKNTEFYKTLTNPEEYEDNQSIDSFINILVNFIENVQQSNNFDKFKSNKKFLLESYKGDVRTICYNHVDKIPVPDIILENETGVPVILLTHFNLLETILFKSGRQIPWHFEDYTTSCNSKKASSRASRLVKAAKLTKMSHFTQFRKTVNCPLFLLKYPGFSESIEYYYNLESFKAMIQHEIKTGPRTRRPFTGAIVPLEEFDDYNDYILSCTYFGKRRVPFNKGLLYYVVYKTCERLEYIEPNVVEYLKGYVIKRIAKTKCFLGLSKMSMDDPLIRVDLTTALWYCLELSSILFKSDPKHFKKEKIRLYCHYSDYMKEILEWFQYDVDTKLVDLRADIFRNVNKLKRIGRREDKIKHILEQVFEKQDGCLLSEMVNPHNIYKLKYLQLDHKKVIDESMLSDEVDINKFVHFMDYVETTFVPVCKTTVRPNFITEDNKSYYEEVITIAKRVVIKDGNLTWEPVEKLDLTRLLSTNKLFISNVKHFSNYPTIEQFKWYVLKKKSYFQGKPVIFATNTMEIIELTYASYKDIGIVVDQFNKISTSSANRAVRLKKEIPFEITDEEISNLIEKSETYIVKREPLLTMSMSEAGPSKPSSDLLTAQKPKKNKSKTTQK